MHEKVPNYQRLESLGNALLDQASITCLFNRFPDKDPQWLMEHKMPMVLNKFLGVVCVDIGFQKHLRHSHAKLQHQNTVYATELEEARLAACESKDYWMIVSDPPKCLPDIVEAFVGAIFIDSDFDSGEVQRFWKLHVKGYFEDMSLYDGFANYHPCSHLHKTLETFSCQHYRLMASLDRIEKKHIVAVVTIHNDFVASSKGKSARCAMKEDKAEEVLAADCNI
ncbi:Dicer-like protein 1 [Elasticomyces elasticus]|nr:Dicer-like protein 1 [Elasticomyces elasticus]